MFCITRFFYEPIGMFRRILFFGIPLAYLIGFINTPEYKLFSINHTFFFTLFPTLMLFQHCFTNTTMFIPEIQDVFILVKEKFIDKRKHLG